MPGTRKQTVGHHLAEEGHSNRSWYGLVFRETSSSASPLTGQGQVQWHDGGLFPGALLCAAPGVLPERPSAGAARGTVLTGRSHAGGNPPN